MSFQNLKLFSVKFELIGILLNEIYFFPWLTYFFNKTLKKKHPNKKRMVMSFKTIYQLFNVFYEFINTFMSHENKLFLCNIL